MKNKHALILMQGCFKEISLGSASFNDFLCILHQILTLEMIAKSISVLSAKLALRLDQKLYCHGFMSWECKQKKVAN